MRRTGSIAGLSLAGLVLGCNAVFGIAEGKSYGDGCPTRADACTDCVPKSLGASGDGEESVGIIVFGDTVIWSAGSAKKLYATAISGGKPRVVADAGGTAFGTIQHLATDGAFIYFTDRDGAAVGRVPKSGSPIETVAVVKTAGAKTDDGRIAYAQGHVYWAMQGSGSVYRARVDGALPATAERVAPVPAGKAIGVATDDAFVYWGSGGTVQRLAFDDVGTSVSPEVVVSGQPDVTEVYVDESHVYWTTPSTVGIAAKKGDGQPVVLAQDEPQQPYRLIADGRYVYWTETGYNAADGHGYLKRAAKSGGEAPLALDTNACPGGYGMASLAQTCDTLYWLDGCIVTARKLAK